jgi:hypothetical protein
MTTEQIGAAKPPGFYGKGEEDSEEHRRMIADYAVATGARADAMTPKDGSELTQMLKLDSTDVAITGDTNDLDLTGYSVVRVTTSALWSVTGIVADANRLLIIINVGSNNLVLENQHASSAIANRLELSGSDRTLSPEETAILWYDPATERWRRIGNT